MERKRQNLFLFFEENDDEKDITSSLVHLYMNRFVIAEEDQTEINGVYNLAQPKENTPLKEFHSQGQFEGETREQKFNNYWKETLLFSENRTKLEHDKSLLKKMGLEITNKTKMEHDKSLFREILKSVIEDVDFKLESDENIQWLDQKWKNFFKENSIFYNSVNHFIIGSSFYVNSSSRRRNFINTVMQRTDMFYRRCHLSLSNCFDELKKEYEDMSKEKRINRSSEESSLYGKYMERLRYLQSRLRRRSYGLHNDGYNIQTLITMLRGNHKNLLTTEQLKIAHVRSEIETDLVNDDLEKFHKFTMDKTRVQSQELRLYEFRRLSFYKELTDPELDKLKSFQYYIDFQNQNWKTQTSSEALLPLIAQTDPGYQYLRCDCQRMSMSSRSSF